MLKQVIKFSADWCQPCAVFAKTFHAVEEMEEYKDIEFKEINIEDEEIDEALVEKFQVRSVPTTVLLDENDNPIFKVIGNVPKKEFVKIINDAINKKEE